jgi:hypothetical protein
VGGRWRERYAGGFIGCDIMYHIGNEEGKQEEMNWRGKDV